MKMQNMNMKKYTFALALVSGFAIALALSSLSIVQAQDWRYRQDRRDDRQQKNDGNYGQKDNNGNIDRNHNGVDDRYENNRNGNVDRNGNIDLNRNGVDDRYENHGRYDNDRFGNGNFRGFGNGAETQRGYRDGLNRGRDDARDGDPFNPRNSGLFRHGNAAYREGFLDGYNRGYRLYDNRDRYGRRW